MNVKEAAKALIDGKKIRKSNWVAEVHVDYIFMKSESTTLSRSDGGYWGELYSFLANDEDWELYKEPEKKKLYAYRGNLNGELAITYFEDDTGGNTRRPEYDLEFE